MSTNTYRCACIYGLSNVASVAQEGRQVDEEIETLREALVQIPGSSNSRTGDDVPIFIGCVLEQFILCTMSAIV